MPKKKLLTHLNKSPNADHKWKMFLLKQGNNNRASIEVPTEEQILAKETASQKEYRVREEQNRIAAILGGTQQIDDGYLRQFFYTGLSFTLSLVVVIYNNAKNIATVSPIISQDPQSNNSSTNSTNSPNVGSKIYDYSSIPIELILAAVTILLGMYHIYRTLENKRLKQNYDLENEIISRLPDVKYEIDLKARVIKNLMILLDLDSAKGILIMPPKQLVLDKRLAEGDMTVSSQNDTHYEPIELSVHSAGIDLENLIIDILDTHDDLEIYELIDKRLTHIVANTPRSYLDNLRNTLLLYFTDDLASKGMGDDKNNDFLKRINQTRSIPNFINAVSNHIIYPYLIPALRFVVNQLIDLIPKLNKALIITRLLMLSAIKLDAQQTLIFIENAMRAIMDFSENICSQIEQVIKNLNEKTKTRLAKLIQSKKPDDTQFFIELFDALTDEKTLKRFLMAQLKLKPNAVSAVYTDVLPAQNLDNQKENPNYQLQAEDINYVVEEILKDKNNVYFLPVQQAHLKNENMHITKALETTAKENIEKRIDVVSIFNKDANHWVAYKISRTQDKELTIFYKDSYGAKYPVEFENGIKQAFPEFQLRFVYSQSKEQNDGVNCGIFAIRNLNQFVNRSTDELMKSITEVNGEFLFKNFPFFNPESTTHKKEEVFKPERELMGTLYKTKSVAMEKLAAEKTQRANELQKSMGQPLIDLLVDDRQHDTIFKKYFAEEKLSIDFRSQPDAPNDVRLTINLKLGLEKNAKEFEEFLKDLAIEYEVIYEPIGDCCHIAITLEQAPIVLQKLQAQPDAIAILVAKLTAPPQTHLKPR